MGLSISLLKETDLVSMLHLGETTSTEEVRESELFSLSFALNHVVDTIATSYCSD